MTKTILVVDDSRSVRESLSELLSTAGYAVLTAEDGQDALERIERTPALSLAICDVNMPRMTGMELLKQVKGQPERASLPMLILTTEGRTEVIREARQLGACGWIVKPVTPSNLLATVRKIVGL
jgi:two-component system, chemotaxis family, chemotaxis protein CheY